jgi:6-phosphogluconolactonase (cycloisomerase 2 family)
LPELLIGTYPAAGFGTPAGVGEGIWRVTLDEAAGELRDPRQVAVTPAPSFLCRGPREDVVYSVSEVADGSVSAWRWVAGALKPWGTCATAGADPCHVRYLPAIGSLVVANYTGGSVAVVPVADDGSLPSPIPAAVFALAGSGPDAERQEGPHAHQSLPSPDGRWLLVNNLGSDTVWRFAVDEASRSLRPDGAAATLPPGTGPRHAAFSEDGAVLAVLGELDGRLHVLRWDAATGTARPGHVVDACPGATAALAHVERAADRLFVGCRGADIVTEFVLGADGTVLFAAAHPLPGANPRHHRVVGDRLVVALQQSHEVVVLGHDGTPRSRAPIPSPACILPPVR